MIVAVIVSKWKKMQVVFILFQREDVALTPNIYIIFPGFSFSIFWNLWIFFFILKNLFYKIYVKYRN